jgi:hypothetical protein
MNFNDEVIIYPSEEGWTKLFDILHKLHNVKYKSNIFISDYVSLRRTEDGGYKEQLWVIISDLHEMFFNGTPYLKNMNINLK